MADFSEIKKEECVVKRIPKGVALNGSRTLVAQSVINAIKIHGRSSMNREVCGVLIGALCWDDAIGAYLLIDARIEGKFANHQAGSVTFTSETWDHIHSELNAKYPDRKIMGWYHTHPGFGIFLSNMDFFIHENFFGNKWQPAYVFDPQAETDGFFFWHENNLELEEVVIIPDEAPVLKKAQIKSEGKISVVLTDEEESKERRRRLSFIVTGLLIIMIGLLTALAADLYRKNIEYERKNAELQDLNAELQKGRCPLKQFIERFRGDDKSGNDDKQEKIKPKNEHINPTAAPSPVEEVQKSRKLYNPFSWF